VAGTGGEPEQDSPVPHRHIDSIFRKAPSTPPDPCPIASQPCSAAPVDPSFPLLQPRPRAPGAILHRARGCVSGPAFPPGHTGPPRARLQRPFPQQHARDLDDGRDAQHAHAAPRVSALPGQQLGRRPVFARGNRLEARRVLVVRLPGLMPRRPPHLPAAALAQAVRGSPGVGQVDHRQRAQCSHPGLQQGGSFCAQAGSRRPGTRQEGPYAVRLGLEQYGAEGAKHTCASGFPSPNMGTLD
jgi:hypothetical protein